MSTLAVVLRRHARQAPPAIALAVILLVMLVVAPGFFSPGNLRDLALNNAPVLLVSIGMTLVVLVGQIDISVGSQFAVCSVMAGVLAKAGVPMTALPFVVLACGAVLGSLNGYLVGYLRLPSIIVTLAMLVTWRDVLRWATDGAWIQDLPANFQWFGLAPGLAEALMLLVTLLVLMLTGWALRNLRGGRDVHAVGSDANAAWLAGIDPRRVTFSVFLLAGALAGLGAVLNAVRFNTVPVNAGTGYELQAVAAVVVGGTAITGGRGGVPGTLLGVLLLGTIGTAMTYVGISPFWAKAIQGAIIISALLADAALARLATRGTKANGAVIVTA